MSQTEEVIAATAFEIVARSFSSNENSERKSFRLKNLTKIETLEFLRTWQLNNKNRGLDRVRVIVASDSFEEFPSEFRADPKNSITYYRNNNENGLVYIETKVESDEQGLQNLFTLRDVNFLDGTFDEEGEFVVPEEMIRQALRIAGSDNPYGNELVRDRLVEVLRQLNAADLPVPVRKYAVFVLAAAKEVVCGSAIYSTEETNALIGRSLVFLDMFPDEYWRQNAGRVGRRLSMNLLRAELAASQSSDLDIDKTAQDCFRTKFVDENGELYAPELQTYWRKKCSEYCLDPDRQKREMIPYRIFEQVFTKDVKGLPLGERLSEEIANIDPSRKAEFDKLAVEQGLNNRSVEDARKFLESEPSNINQLPLKDLLSKQTLRLVEKLAAPAVERVENPLIQLSKVAKDFRERNDLSRGQFKIELRAGPSVTKQHTPTIGLFAFLYGRSLIEISGSLSDGVGNVFLEIDERLTTQIPVPQLKKEVDAEDEASEEASSEEEEGTVWFPLMLEFVLLSIEDKKEIDSEPAVEWFPDDFVYLALFWISLCGDDKVDLAADFHAPGKIGGEAWIVEVVNRTLSFRGDNEKPYSDEILKDPIIRRLIEIRSMLRNEVAKDGLSTQLLNDVFDQWSALLAEARNTFIPNGDIPVGMLEFLNADCIQEFDGDQLLMLQSHPLKLRWLAAYLTKSTQLATDAIEGSLKLNEQNENLYLNWIQNLSPHQQPSIHSTADGKIMFAGAEKGWTEIFQRPKSSARGLSRETIHSSLVAEIVRQITAYLYSHPYKADGLRLLVVTGGASSLPAEIVQGVRKGDFKNLSMTIECVVPRSCWEDASRQFELVDTDNRLSGETTLFPPVQLNLHDLEKVKEDADAELGQLVCDIAIVPKFIDDNVSTDTKTEDETSSIGKFDPLLDDPTYIASGAGGSTLWVSLRPKMSDKTLSDWSTLAVRHERRNPVAADRTHAADFIDIRINFQSTAGFFEALHRCSHWVITLERHITREQIERLETRPEVLSVRDDIGPSGLYTLIVSSNAGKDFVIDRLKRKLKRIASIVGKQELENKQAQYLAQKIYNEARQISPRLTLDALGISRVTEEILGLSIARQIADHHLPARVSDGFVAWISLDEHPEWFASSNSMRADMLRLAVDIGDKGLSVDLLILESKLRRGGYETHGAEQVRKTLQMFSAAFPQHADDDPMDGELWRDSLLAAIDSIGEHAVSIFNETKTEHAPRRSRVSEEIRNLFRKGEFAAINISGLYSICEYSHSRDLVIEPYDVDPRVKVAQSGGVTLVNRIVGASVEKGSIGDHRTTLANENEESSMPIVDSKTEILLTDDAPQFDREPVVADSPKVKSGAAQNVSDTSALHIAKRLGQLGKAELDHRYQLILDTFGQYGISVNKTDQGIEHAIEGPASILYRISPGKGVEPRRLIEKSDTLKLALKLNESQEIRFAIDGGYMTIDVPKLDKERYFVEASDLWSRWSRPEVGLSVPLGEDRFGKIVVIDFTSTNSPHLLIGGTTGSGKSEALNTILGGLIKNYSPDEVRLLLIDPKGTELQHLSDSKHVEGEIGWDEADAIEILTRAVDEMQARYARFKRANVRTLGDFNAQASESQRLPRWVIVLDEYADLTSEPDAKKTIEANLKRLAQKARAAGIHVIIATQKPDASVISTNLRSNLPAQLALRVKSSTESRVIMDDVGAESLTGKGDAFLKESGILIRVQCAKI